MANLNQWLNDYATQVVRQNTGGVCEHCASALGHFSSCILLHNYAEVLHAEPTPTANLSAVESDVDQEMADRIMAHAFGVRL